MSRYTNKGLEMYWRGYRCGKQDAIYYGSMQLDRGNDAPAYWRGYRKGFQYGMRVVFFGK